MAVNDIHHYSEKKNHKTDGWESTHKNLVYKKTTVLTILVFNDICEEVEWSISHRSGS